MTAASDGTIRLGGLTSGFDTESIVQQLLQVDQAAIDKLKEDKEINQAKIDTWNDVSEQLKSFADAVTALRADGTTGNTLYDDKLPTSSDTTVVSASANNSAIEADYAVTVTTLARSMVAYGSQKAASYTLPAGGDVIINGSTITLAAGDTLSDIAGKISAATYTPGEEIVATVVDDRLVLQTKNTGVSQSIYGTAAGSPPFVNGTDDASNILRGQLGLIDAGGDLTNIAQTAADADYTINGIPVTSSSNTVTDAISGVTLTLSKAGSANLAVKVNTAAIKEAITDFIDGYNETRDLIDRVRNAKLDESEEFGLFFSDPLLRSLFQEVRSLSTTGVKMGGSVWNGSTTSAAAALGASSVTINNFDAATGTLSAGDEFIIDGHSTIYTVQSDATIAGNSATVSISPPLEAALAGGEGTSPAYRTIEDFGVGVRTDTVSGIDGVLGVLDEGELDSMLSSNSALVKRIFTRNDSDEGSTGVARRLYDWIDSQTKISVFQTKTRNIEDIAIDGLENSNESLDEQIARLEERMAVRETALIRQFADMENAMARAQSSGAAISGLNGGGGQ